MTLISDCCGMPAGGFFDVGICPACREHCEWIDDGEPVVIEPRKKSPSP